MTTPAPQQVVERALELATSDACVVLVRTGSDTNLRWARNTLTTNGETAESSVTVVAIVGEGADAAAGSVTRSGLDLDALPDLVAQATAAAREAGPAQDALPLVAGSGGHGDWAEPPARTSSAAFGSLAPSLGEVFRAAAADGVEHFGFASHAIATTYLGTSTGVRLRHAQPEGRVEMTAKSHGRSRSAWIGRAGTEAVALDVGALDEQLRQRLEWQAHRIEVAPGRHDAVLSPSAVSDLVIDLYWSAIGRSAAEGRSVFSAPGGGTRLGQRIAVPTVTLHSDPALPGLESAPFVAVTASSSATSVFDNGVPVERTTWIDQGELTALITTRASAAEFDLPFRPAVDNLSLAVAGADGDLLDLVGRTDDGLLVTCLWYNRVVDPQTLLLTGLTRDGVYVVRGGEVVGATTNFRFNDSPVSMLDRVADAGATEPTLAREMGDYFNRAAMPPLRVSGFNFSTVSQAS